MPRSSRLLALMQCLRRYRQPVSAARLAEQLGVSPRTIYRDIGALRAEGAPIEGEAGIGYVLRPGFFLPPLMFSDDEIEALVLGLRWASEHGDAHLAEAGGEALAKISAVLPDELRRAVDAATLLVGPEAPHIDHVDRSPFRSRRTWISDSRAWSPIQTATASARSCSLKILAS